MKNYLLMLLLLFLIVDSYAQVDPAFSLDSTLMNQMIVPMSSVSQATLSNTMPRIAPPSPHAAEIGRFGAVPVGLYTGTVQYSVPIFELKNAHLTLPVQLNYSSNGLKVDKLASWVGYDWSLSAGGVINRYRKGKADIPGARPYSDWGSLSTSEKLNLLYLLEGYEHDLQPDIFVINLPNFTCKFAFNNDGDPVTIPYKPIKIETNSTGAFTYFNITTPDGILYKFEDEDYSVPPSESSFPTSWHLTEIVHPTGEKITFSYTNYSFYQKVGIDRKVMLNLYCSGYDPSNACGYTAFNEQITEIHNGVSYLDKIEFSGVGKIYFDRSSGRSDAPNEYKLDKIRIEDNYGNQIKAVSFNYQFPLRRSVYSCQISTTSDVNYRMFLSSINEQDASSSTVKTFSFEYNDISGLPARFSYSQDHWGYFNGKYNNDLVSISDVPSGYQGLYSGHVGSTADRSANYSYSQKGMLKKITYPTGGYSTFDYEANKNSSNIEIGGCRLLRTNTYESSTASPIIKKYNYLQSSTTGSLYPTYFQTQSTYFKYSSYPNVYSGKCNYGILSANSLNLVCVEGQNFVCYGLVEVLSGENGENGKEQHSFNIVFDAPGTPVNGGQIYPIPMSNNGWSSGLKKGVLTSSSSVSVKKEDINYNLNETRNQEEIKCLVTRSRNNPYYSPMTDLEKLTYYDVVPYTLFGNWFYVNSSVVTQYNSVGDVVTTTTNIYGNEDHCQLTEKLITDSNGKVQKNKFYYPHDYSTTGYNISTLKLKNIIEKPLDVRTYYDSQLASGTQIKYNSDGLPTDIYVAEPTGTDITFSSVSPYGFSHKSAYSYTNDAVTQVTPDDNCNTTYLWDATGNYLMAQIENASFSQVSSLNGKEYSFSSITLYSNLNSILGDDVLITTYTHDPLTGITQHTDEAGVTTYYEYDSFGRLSSVKNDDGKLLKKYDYNYAD